MPRTFVWHPRRGPAYTAPDQPATGGMVRIEQVRSGIGQTAAMRRTLAAIGLRRHQAVVIQKDTPSLRGMLKQVRHLVQVTPVEE